MSSLVSSSLLVRAGDLRYRTAAELEKQRPFFLEQVSANLSRITADMNSLIPPLRTTPILVCEDARNLAKIPVLDLDGVVTSPPYLNGTNYFRNTKLELWFLGCLRTKRDLTEFRKKALPSGINDVVGDRSECHVREVKSVVDALQKCAYDRRIPILVSTYFSAVEEVFQAIKRHLRPQASIVIDIGDSQFCGVHVPTHELLVKTLESIGYTKSDEVVLRARRSRCGRLLTQNLLVFRNGDL
jgi:DNA modification methylase